MFPDSFEIKLSELGNDLDRITGEACKAGAKAVLPVLKSNLQEAIGGTKNPSRSSGELVNSLGISPPEVDRKGVINVKIGFNEPRKKQYAAKGKRSYNEITNAMLANVIEHGKHGQPAKPFLARSKRQSKKRCIAAMKRKLDEEISKL
jgi:hypothetical protein